MIVTQRWLTCRPSRLQSVAVLSVVALSLMDSSGLAEDRPIEIVFPEASWSQREPGELGLDAGKLDDLAKSLGGRGCVIRHGHVVKSWGDQAEVGDWFSSAKPVLSTLLFFAIQEGRVKSVDQPLVDFGWELSPKDRTMTFRHLGAMSSGYARPESPGAAWAYNDFAIQLYQKTLFDRVFQGDAKEIAEHPTRLGVLKFEDGLKFNAKRRISASVRDFSRIVWFWFNRGNWKGRQVLPSRFFDEYMQPQAPKDLPLTRPAETNDYLGINSYGGGSDHFSQAGAGVYGFNWWFNSTGRGHLDSLTWPDAPVDTVMSLGHKGNNSAIIPSLGLALVCANGDWGDLEAGKADSKLNLSLKLLASAVTDVPAAQAEIPTATQWQPTRLSFDGPELEEQGTPNPFTDFRLDVTFQLGARQIVVPGYFAADGHAAETSADKGHTWRVQWLPDTPGLWKWTARFRTGAGVAFADQPDVGTVTAFDGQTGSIRVNAYDPAAPGFYSKGLLQYTSERYLRFAATGEAFLKGGADSPENLLAFADFDQTEPTHRYEPHAADFKEGDVTWQGGQGKNLVGALNYLASKEMNSVYFLTMNVKGDGKDVWPWTSRDERMRFDCSKLDQWELVFRHMDKLGLVLHLVHQETENDQLLDGGELGPERRLYYRELIARFGHHPAIVWNLGEENTNTLAQQQAFAQFFGETDPYRHPRVIHTFPSQVEQVYAPLLGDPNFEGTSFQFGKAVRSHPETVDWLTRSEAAGRPWFACMDEIGPASICLPPDVQDPEHPHEVRHALWGNLMAGGSGAEWIVAYDTWPRVPGKHLDIACENFRPWENIWALTAIANRFFREHVPFTKMRTADPLVEKDHAWCLAQPGEVYVVYLFGGQQTTLELPEGAFTASWFSPWTGGDLIPGPTLKGPGLQPLGEPPSDKEKDWVLLVRRAE